MVLDVFQLSVDLCFGEAPREVWWILDKACRGCEEDERSHPVWVACSEHKRLRASAKGCEEGGLGQPGGFEYARQILYTVVERRCSYHRIRQSGTAPVVDDNAHHARQLLDEGSPRKRRVVVAVDTAEHGRHPDQRRLAVAIHAICQAYIAVADIPNPTLGHPLMVALRSSAGCQIAGVYRPYAYRQRHLGYHHKRRLDGFVRRRLASSGGEQGRPAGGRPVRRAVLPGGRRGVGGTARREGPRPQAVLGVRSAIS